MSEVYEIPKKWVADQIFAAPRYILRPFVPPGQAFSRSCVLLTYSETITEKYTFLTYVRSVVSYVVYSYQSQTQSNSISTKSTKVQTLGAI